MSWCYGRWGPLLCVLGSTSQGLRLVWVSYNCSHLFIPFHFTVLKIVYLVFIYYTEYVTIDNVQFNIAQSHIFNCALILKFNLIVKLSITYVNYTLFIDVSSAACNCCSPFNCTDLLLILTNCV